MLSSATPSSAAEELNVLCHQGVEPGHAFHALGQSGPAQPAALAIADLDVVMFLGPVRANEHLHSRLPPLDRPQQLRRARGDQQLPYGSVLYMVNRPGIGDH